MNSERCDFRSILRPGLARGIHGEDTAGDELLGLPPAARGLLSGAWHRGLKEALAGLTAADATRRPRPALPTIWEQVLHITVWKRELAALVRGGSPSGELYDGAGDWPPQPAEADEDEWEGALSDLLGAHRDLDEALAGKPVGAGHLPDQAAAALGCLGHDSYHCGQIIMARRLLGLWK